MKVNEKLDAILKNLESNQAIVNMELSLHDWRTRPGMELMQERSKALVVDLTLDYHKAFTESVVKIFINGTDSQINNTVTEIERVGVDVFRPTSLYQNVAELVWPTLSSGNMFSTASHLRLMELLGDLGRSHGIVPQYNPRDPGNVIVENSLSLTNLVRNIIRESFGDTLNRAYILNRVASLAIARKFNGDKAVVLLENMIMDEISVFSESIYTGQPSLTIEIDQNEEPNYKSIATKINNKVVSSLLKKAELQKENLQPRNS